MWDLPGPGIKPETPALQGGFLTTGLPGKPLLYFWVYSHKNGKQDLGLFSDLPGVCHHPRHIPRNTATG